MTVRDDTAGHCITCSDEAVPMRVVELLAGSLARCVDEDDTAAEVMVDLVDGVRPGDTLLVHAGVALLAPGVGEARP